jgi:hypothetical protein
VTYHESDRDALGSLQNTADHGDANLESPVLGLADLAKNLRVEYGNSETVDVQILDHALRELANHREL